MSLYDLKIKRLALLLLPTFYRKPLIAAFAQSMVQGVNIVYGNFMRWRQDKQYRLSHNGQVCYLRAVLNDQFDPIERRITITDGTANMDLLTLYCRDMDMAALVPSRGSNNSMTLYRRGSGENGYDFWVNIPVALYDTVDTERLRAIVDAYKLASKRFSINYI